MYVVIVLLMQTTDRLRAYAAPAAAMPLNPCMHTNKYSGLSVVENTSKISVLLGVSCTNFEFFYIDQNPKPRSPIWTQCWNTCD